MTTKAMGNLWADRLFGLLTGIVKIIWGMFNNAWGGLRSFELPMFAISIWSLFGYLLVCSGSDLWIWHWIGWGEYAPMKGVSISVYTIFLSAIGLWFWLLISGIQFLKYRSKWDRFVRDAKLESPSGHKPKLIKIREQTDGRFELWVHLAGISTARLETKAEVFAGVFGAEYDRINQQKDGEVSKVTYSFSKVPKKYEFPANQRLSGSRYLVGRSRYDRLEISFKDSPHLLIAGQTGGGKSTFLRQLIYSNIVSKNRPDMLLIDLKEGLEFQSFDNLEGVTIAANSEKAIEAIRGVTCDLKKRLVAIRKAKAKDIDSYNRKRGDGDKQLPRFARKLVVIDEVAEAVLASPSNVAANALAFQSHISQIARLGRAAGIHLILATQRPDAKCLNGQIRSNMSTRICFKMPDIGSSMIILSNKSAYEIPAIPGRAMMQDGLRMVEVQTPYLSAESLDELLEPRRIKVVQVLADTKIKVACNKSKPIEAVGVNASKDKV